MGAPLLKYFLISIVSSFLTSGYLFSKKWELSSCSPPPPRFLPYSGQFVNGVENWVGNGSSVAPLGGSCWRPQTPIRPISVSVLLGHRGSGPAPAHWLERGSVVGVNF